MARPGPKPMPAPLRVLRGTVKEAPAPRLPATCPVEPRWADLLPGRTNVTLRADCGRVWASLVPELDRHRVLARVDEVLVIDACVCVARIRQCERALAREGLTRMTEHGLAKNPLTTVVAAYRTQLRAYVAELGLSPSSRARLPWDTDDGDDELAGIFS